MRPSSAERGPSLLPSSLQKALQLLWSLVGMHTSFRTRLQESPCCLRLKGEPIPGLITQQEKAWLCD